MNDENKYLHRCDIWAKLLRAGILSCKLETFYKYARIAANKLGIVKKKTNCTVRVIAKSSLTILHTDCTQIRTDDGGRWYLNIIYDNFSKAILGIKAMLNPNSLDVAENLRVVIRKYKLHEKRFLLYCDGGPENRKHVDELLADFPQIVKCVTSFSKGIYNNVIESYNNKFKRKHIHFLDLSCHEKVPDQLPDFRKTLNDVPMALIGALSPNEVLKGLKPWEDIWPQLKNNMDEAKIQRIFVNQLSCCSLPT